VDAEAVHIGQIVDDLVLRLVDDLVLRLVALDSDLRDAILRDAAAGGAPSIERDAVLEVLREDLR
jgi:hypothetical protein